MHGGQFDIGGLGFDLVVEAIDDAAHCIGPADTQDGRQRLCFFHDCRDRTALQCLV